MKEKRIELTPQQDKFIFSEDRFTCIKGTWGCGKSLAGLLAAHKECLAHPGNLYLIIRKEWVDLRDSTLKDWGSEIDMPIINNNVKYDNGSVLMFRHGDDINALKNSNLGGALMVQAEEMNEEDFWFLNGRLRRKEGTRQLRLECNYDGHNWIYKLFNMDKTGALVTTNTFDNEVNLPNDYIPNLMKLPKKLRDRHLYGSDADMEGQIWDEFSLEDNVIQPYDIPKEWNRICILDHGIKNPTAVLWLAIDFDGNLIAYDEHYEADKIVSYHADQIKLRDNSNVQDWLIDPSCNAKTRSNKNGQFYSIVDEYRDEGIIFRPADNAVLAGINRVNEFLKRKELKIFKSCTNLIDEIQGYKWQKLKPGVEKNEPDAPVKKKDHLCDCLRYGVMSRPVEPEHKVKIVEGSEADYDRMAEQMRERREEIESMVA